MESNMHFDEHFDQDDHDNDHTYEGREVGGGDGDRNRLEGEAVRPHDNGSDDSMSIREEEEGPQDPGDAVHLRDGVDVGAGEMAIELTSPMDPLDPLRMVLSNEEQERANAIKAAIEQDKELDNLTGFAYAQLALMGEDNIDNSLERAAQLQCFRQEHKILDTFEDCRRSFREFMEKFPKTFLSFAFNKSGGNYCLVYDMTAFDLQTLTQPDNTLALMRGIYYLCHAFTPDFHAIRKGVIFLVECQDFDWKKNASPALFQRSWMEILGVYPLQFDKMKYFHTGFFMNMINSLKKRFLPRRITDKIETGCQFEGRLSDVYLVPTVEAARERLIHRMEYTVGLRYENARTFRLSAPPG